MVEALYNKKPGSIMYKTILVLLYLIIIDQKFTIKYAAEQKVCMLTSAVQYLR